MSNHYHLVAFIDKQAALSLSNQQVIDLWCTEHQMPSLIQKLTSGKITCSIQAKACDDIISIWRERLYSLSWFMKELNYDIAVQANKEDQCTGHFWEGRFKSQALLDEKALLSAMAYVDLNPVRSNIADTPEQSDHTSIKTRLTSLHENPTTSTALLSFIGGEQNNKTQGIPFRLMDYIELVDWVGKQVREDKRGSIDGRLPNILNRLSFAQQDCLMLCTELEKKPRLWIGSSLHLTQAKQKLKRQRMRGICTS
jgi:REP element-mobilizing transposase RayT